MTITVFLSHRWAEGEHDFTMELGKKLASRSNISPVIDQSSLKAGDDIRRWMTESIKYCDVLLFVISPASMSSRYCRFELSQARKYEKPIIPLLLKDTDLPKWLSRLKWISFKDDTHLPYHKIEELVDAIEHHFEKLKSIIDPDSPALSISAVVGQFFVRSWMDRTRPPTAKLRNPVSHIHIEVENISTIPREIRCSMRVIGNGIKFGPTRDLRLLDSLDFLINDGSGGIPLTLSAEYKSGDASVEIDLLSRRSSRSAWIHSNTIIGFPVVTDWQVGT